MNRRLPVVVVVSAGALVGACALDFDRFLTVAAADAGLDAGPRDDTGLADDPPGDQGAPDTAAPTDEGVADAPPDAPPDAPVASCPPPVLLAAVEDLSASAITRGTGGYVARRSLRTGARCADLDGGGSLPNQPLAVTQLRSGLVGVAFRDAVHVLDARGASQGAFRGVPSSGLPVDAFPLQGDGPWFAVAWQPPTGDGLQVHVFDERAQRRFLWMGSEYRGLGMTASPLGADHFLVLRSSRRDTVDVTAGIAAAPRVQPYVDVQAGDVTRVYSLPHGEMHLTVWTRLDPPPGTAPHLDNPFAAGPYQSQAPRVFPCATRCRTLVQVVPDPLQPDKPLALCETGTDTVRLVVRAGPSFGDACVVLDGADLAGSRTRISYLAIATR